MWNARSSPSRRIGVGQIVGRMRSPAAWFCVTMASTVWLTRTVSIPENSKSFAGIESDRFHSVRSVLAEPYLSPFRRLVTSLRAADSVLNTDRAGAAFYLKLYCGVPRGPGATGMDTGVEKILVTGRDLWGTLAFTLSGDSLRGTGTPGHCVAMNSAHVSVHDAERYYLGMVTEDEELAPLEEHLLWCHGCLDLVQETEDYVDTSRVALLNMSEMQRVRHVSGRPEGAVWVWGGRAPPTGARPGGEMG